MTNPIQILVAEDDVTSLTLLEQMLVRQGYSVMTAQNGKTALAHLKVQKFDVVITDWMMPELDGIALIRAVRTLCQPAPIILMVTSFDTPMARDYAITSGADDFVLKPYLPDDIFKAIHNCLAQVQQPSTNILPPANTLSASLPLQPKAFAAVGMCASSGGPATLQDIFGQLRTAPKAIFLLVLAIPSWGIEAFFKQLEQKTNMNVVLAEHEMPTQPGTIYVAKPNHYFGLHAETLTIELIKGPFEHGNRTSADYLFRSLAETFGPQAVAVVLTGIGSEGTAGAQYIVAAGGIVLVQDPITADAPQMPQAAIDSGVAEAVVPLSNLGRTISNYVEKALRHSVSH